MISYIIYCAMFGDNIELYWVKLCYISGYETPARRAG